jgi:hypothetical protein
VVLYHPRRKAGRRGTQCRGKVALGLDVDGEHTLSGARSEQGQGGGNRAPTGAAFPRNEDDPTLQQGVEIDPLTSDRALNRR